MTPIELELQTMLSDWKPLIALLVGYQLVVIALAAFGRGKLSADPRDIARRIADSLERLTKIPGWAAAMVGTSTFGLLIAGIGLLQRRALARQSRSRRQAVHRAAYRDRDRAHHRSSVRLSSVSSSRAQRRRSSRPVDCTSSALACASRTPPLRWARSGCAPCRASRWTRCGTRRTGSMSRSGARPTCSWSSAHR